MSTRRISGDQLVQVRNPDPFAAPVWRSPVYHTPGWIIGLAQLSRQAWRLIRFAARHPVGDLLVLVLVLAYRQAGWPGPVVLVLAAAAVFAVWRLRWPASFTRWAWYPALARWRRSRYQLRWHAVMAIAGLAPEHRGRTLLPALGKVTTTGCTDRIVVGLVSGQSPADLADRTDNIAHGLGAISCRVRSARPGMVMLELVRRDALADPIPALPLGPRCDLAALPVGRCEDGQPWTIRLHGTHVLLAGATGAGKASLLWGLARAMLPAILAGLVRPVAADPKLMELAYGRSVFDRYGTYAADPYAIADTLETEVGAMQRRAADYAGRHRTHTPTAAHPFVVIFVDEVAFLTCYHPDKQLRERVKAALATLTTQGRAVGWCVVATLQDPRKEVMPIRNLFPDRIAMRLDEPDQVDMVLGDGARDRGAHADLISTVADIGAGVAYVRLEADPDPVRVRAAWVTDADIAAMTLPCLADSDRELADELAAIEAGATA